MDFIFKALIKDYENVKEQKVRDRYGKLAGIVGIVSNLALCIMKYAIGFFTGSIAIMADAINNLADASSSVITLIGFKLAGMPEDKEHPYGHARIEYIAGMVVSVIIIAVGIMLAKESVLKIINPEAIVFSWTAVAVLLIAIVVKILQALFNVAAGKKINSVALIATGTDSRNDVISTTAVLIATIVSGFTDLQIDGYLGFFVAVFIVWSGISLTKETISPLLGESPDIELVRQIHDICMSYEGVIGIHDLVVHNYGPGKVFCSVHIEVDSKVDVMESHDLVDQIEYRLRKELKIFATTHMDPIDMSNPNREPVQDILVKAVSELEGITDFHDLRFVAGPTHTNVIFDIGLAPDCKLSEEEITTVLSQKIKEYDPKFFVVINFDLNYIV